MQKIRMNKKNSFTIREGCERFNRWCNVMNYAPDTIDFYNRIIHKFSLFYDLDSPIIDLNADLIEEYSLHLKQEDISSTTYHCYMRGLKRIINFFVNKDYITPFDIQLPKTVKPIKEVYTNAELKELLRKPNLKTCRFVEYRNWVLVNYLLGTGQRRNTVAHIKIKDLDLQNAIVRLNITKNKKETVLPLTSSLVAILEEYLSYRKGEPEDYLFCDRNGKKISSDAITNAVRRYNLSRGVEKTSPHCFRHTFAYLSLKNKMDIFRLQRLMCHSDIKTTQGYLRAFNLDDLREDYEAFNPLEAFAGEGAITKSWNQQQGKRR